MGYVETVLGYSVKGRNHRTDDTEILRLIAKKVTLNGENVDPTKARAFSDLFDLLREADDNNIDADVEITLHDDIVSGREQELYFERYNQYYEAMYGAPFLQYKKNPDILVGYACCFDGIIVHTAKVPGDDTPKYETPLEERLQAAKDWVAELRKTSRISGDWELVMLNNCCS